MSTQLKLDRSAFIAWEEILSDDLKIKLSNTIIQEFSSKHIKGEFAEIIKNMNFSKKEIQEEINEYIDSMYKDKLNKAKESLEDEFRKILRDKTKELISKTDLYIKELEYTLERNIKTNFEEMFQKYSPSKIN